MATAIGYVEDPDSLRFALSVADEYDIASLQPHFPGYPVFWAVVKPLYVAIGSFSTAFAIVGGLATAGLIAAVLHLWKQPLTSTGGAALAAVLALNPLIWLMGTRYMPDLLGTACAWAALAFLLRALPDDGRLRGRIDERAALWGTVYAGLLAGLRLSYAPLVLLPALVVLVRSRHPIRLVLAGAASVLLWLVPMTVDTGWQTLVDVAWTQTEGHFTEFGGTVQTESDVGRRTAGFLQGVWADGFGAWWPGRHPLTGAVAAGVLGIGGVGAWHLRHRVRLHDAHVWIGVASVAAYAVWVFFFQNVIHKSRHVLPLLPALALVLAVGARTLWHGTLWHRKLWMRSAVLAACATYASVTLVLALQHQSPSAIAQAKAFVDARSDAATPTRIASVPLVNTYLRAQRVEAQYVSVKDSSAVQRLRHADAGQTLVVGTYTDLLPQPPDSVRRFYHNPFVNRMWPDVTVFIYEH
jgi:hypothetical protein